MSNIHNEFLIALINTITLTLIAIAIGKIIDSIVNNIARFMIRHIGSGLTKFIVNHLTFIGTIHHELSHAIFAFCTGAKVIEIKPFSGTGATLGYVKYIPRGNFITKSIQNTMSAIAPVLTGIISEYLLFRFVYSYDLRGWQYSILIYVMISILFHMNMSTQDIKVSLKGLPICMVIIYVVIYFSGLNIFKLI